MQRTGDPARSQQLTLQALADLRQEQAAPLAFFDVFWLFAVLSRALVFLVLLKRRSVAEPAEHNGGGVGLLQRLLCWVMHPSTRTWHLLEL